MRPLRDRSDALRAPGLLGRAGTWIVVAAALILGGGALAAWTQTAGGTVRVEEVRWVGSDGAGMSALLYVPRGATPERPAPGILAVHGYINSRETQSGFAIELARRGYVVLALDQTGHGYSDPPAFARGFGGPEGLAYLRTLGFVDADHIGLEGHSMGGWAVGMAAAEHPEAYRSVVLVGSSTGSFGVPDGTPQWPRNVAVVWARWDEFSSSMWGTPVSARVGGTQKMRRLFGTAAEVAIGRVYGSVEAGTARVLLMPRTNHPGEHLSPAAIGATVAWFQRTLRGGTSLPPSDQIWHWKEVGTLVSAAGMVLLLLAVGRRLLESGFFGELRADPAPGRGAHGRGWWTAATAAALLGPLSFFPLKAIPERVGWTPGPLFPQAVTNSVIAWTSVLGAVTLLLFAAWHLASNRGAPAGDAYGLTWGSKPRWDRIAKSLALSLLTVASGYVALLTTHFLFQTDFRFWVFAVKPMSLPQLRAGVAYLVPFAVFFLVQNLVLFGQLRRDDWSTGRSLGANLAVLLSGWVGLLFWQYVPLFATGTMAIPSEPLWTIIAYQLLPLMTIAALVLTVFNRWTGTIYAGAFTTALLVAWIVVASQATHHAVR